PTMTTPALLTRTSTAPAASAPARTCASSVTYTCSAEHEPPARCTSAAVASAELPSRSQASTRTPRSATRRARRRSILLLAPLLNARRPDRLIPRALITDPAGAYVRCWPPRGVG